MGVEEVQKINSLAKELLKHHIASSSEDAYVQAELMVKGEAPKVNREDEVNRDLRMLGLKLNSMYNEIVALQAEIKGLKDEMTSIKKKIESFRVVEQPRAEPVHQPPNEQQAIPPAKTEQASRPRTGDYQEKDVQIEKFFYYGKK
ncbi:hypothetical protein HYU11_01750 [Candidatus Woesearchaeota archaeon]|nr:hypothetical protein [Candidatus Woesearchaeota archaeon]